jgi:hypothetical protein
MEARSQLRHRPTDKLLLVYTSEPTRMAGRRAERAAKFRRRAILTAGLSPEVKASSIAARYAVYALVIGNLGDDECGDLVGKQ